VSVRNVIYAVAGVITALSMGVGTAAAFEPPLDPAEQFNGGGAGGHPGASGLNVSDGSGDATGTNSSAAWEAHVNADPITNF
jgi:hypothetical protein